MKKVTFFLFFVLNAFISSAQTQMVEAKVSAATCKRMTVTFQGTIAYVKRESIPFNSNLTSGVSDLANVGFYNGRFTVPSAATLPFWFVPFDSAPAMQISGGEYCPSCNCNSSGTCIQVGSNCKGITCDDCETVTSVCGGAVVSRGSIAIIQASQIIFN